MKAFTNVDPATVSDAVAALSRARAAGQDAVVCGGGSDLLGLIKDRIVQPDVVVNLKTIRGLRGISRDGSFIRIGGLTTLDQVAGDPVLRSECPVLSEAAAAVGTPQIRNTGTIAGNVCQRPWCWYLRNGFPCYKNGGDRCFARGGENQQHAVFSAGPTYIVHPSDTAPALVALDASFTIAGAGGEREVRAQDFFVMSPDRPDRENVLQTDEILTRISVPRPEIRRRSTYRKVLDREAWTHAVASAAVILEMDRTTCVRARVVLGGVAPVPLDRPAAARELEGRRITPDVAARAADAAVKDARPLSKNAYKVPLTRGLVRRTILALAARGGEV